MTWVTGVEKMPLVETQGQPMMRIGHWFNNHLRGHLKRRVVGHKPYGMRVSDRVWKRHSALLMTLNEPN